MAQHLAQMKQDKATTHHKFLSSVAAYIEQMNEGRKRVRDTDSIRNPQSLTFTQCSEAVGGPLLPGSPSCAVVHWAKAYPGRAVPPAEQCGIELWQGRPTRVAYVPREGAKKYDLDIEDKEGTGTFHSTQVAQVEENNPGFQQEGLSAKKQRMMENHATKLAEVAKITEESEGVAVMEVEENSTDSSTSSSPKSDNDFLKVIDPFGLTSVAKASKASKSTPKVAPELSKRWGGFEEG